ncbi:MAG: carbohydrate kinase family protein [Sutterellaceae bacterium]|nr:carbohydrate kinase family protein [Burkholderiaceae bacterium]MDW8429607.1 carbohydrate kinase family protein [Sutterellaceae bacterium]
MSILVCGSIAYDSIMLFRGRFRDHILPEQVHILNVAFLVPELRREFGGCAGNIAYSMRLLGAAGLPMATVGEDAQPYLDRLDALGIDRRYVRQVSGHFTAQAFITTDLDDNQITAFHPGAMMLSHLNAVPGDAGIRLGIVAPDGRDGMLQHAQQFADHGIPFVFDPGQGLPMFDGEELRWFIARAHYVAVNDYEAKLLQERTGQTVEELARRLRALVVTRGAQGSLIYVNGSVLEIPAAPARAVVDPTGCGDAYRAALLYGIDAGLDWETTGRLAAVMGALKIEHAGAQNHTADRDTIAQRFRGAFGYLPW